MHYLDWEVTALVLSLSPSIPEAGQARVFSLEGHYSALVEA